MNLADALHVYGGTVEAVAVYAGGEQIWPSSVPFNPWSEAYPTPAHSVWAEDPNWENPGDGNPVVSWRNESGGGDPTTSIANNRPLFRASTAAYNGRPTVEFISNDYLNADGIADVAQPFVIVAVANTSGANNTAEGIVGSSSTGASRIGDSGANQWTYNFGTASTGGTTDSNPHVFVAVINGSSSQMYVDGALVVSGSAGSGALTEFTLGASHGNSMFGQFLQGHIAFVGIYAGKTSRDIDIQTLEAGLRQHYGI